MESTLRVLTGYLYLDDSDAQGLRVKVGLAEDALTVSNGKEPLGTWTPLATEVEEIGSERFRLILGSERVVFAPDDPVEFRYEIAPQLGDKDVRKGWLESRRAKKARVRQEKPPEWVGKFREIAANEPEPAPEAVEESPDPSVDVPAVQPEPPDTKIVEPKQHEPLVAPPPAPAVKKAPRRKPSTPTQTAEGAAARSGQPAKKGRKPSPSAEPPVPEDPATDPPDPEPAPVAPEILPTAAEKTLGTAGQAAAASFEKAKQAPAAISSGVRRLFIRGDVEDHRHDFESSNIPGGLVRHICADCGHVSVDLRDETKGSGRKNSLFQRRISM